ncbi:MAG: type II toxin-antitoxin system PemK/MazF family toxin [Verrucomicrobia bacterium]|nr:type II toxin-antitoxin system PemK/MazF family toxin [Verrucomicrobiota bacterium]
MFGAIYLCEFPFTSGATTKRRPVLVVFDLARDAVVCRVTSVAHSGTLDVMLADWVQAGLAKPSFARLDRLLTAETTIFRRKLGQLSAQDQTAVRNAWNQHMRL